MDSASIFAGMIFGSIGVGYFIYGKKQQKIVALLAGIALCVFPFFVATPWLMILMGVALMAAPFVFRV